MPDIQPIVCLADSQLLFWREDGATEPWLATTLARTRGEIGRAAYVGASNGDDPAFYAIFEAAMDNLGVAERRMIVSAFPAEDQGFLAQADLVVLAGGDPLRGWRIMEQSGIGEAITARHLAGAVLVGVSAGAVQLGWAVSGDDEEARRREVELAFRLVPAILGAHEEDEDWRRLRRLMAASELGLRGLGIPSGGGLVYHPDGVLEPVRYPVTEWVRDEGGLRQNLLLPGEIDPLEPASGELVH